MRPEDELSGTLSITTVATLLDLDYRKQHTCAFPCGRVLEYLGFSAYCNAA